MISRLLRKLTDEPLKRGTATFLNPYSYLRLRQYPELCERMDSIYVDGVSLTIALRLVGIRVARRSMDMTSLAPEVLGAAQCTARPVAFVGGHQGVAEMAASVLCAAIGDFDIRCYSGYFANESERSQVLAEIAKTPEALVLVGMGAIAQEKFIFDLTKTSWDGTAYSCGGFFHQTASSMRAQYYPPWAAKFGLRWLYRILDEPKLIRRYAFDYGRFAAVFLFDIVQYRRRLVRDQH